MVQNPLVASVVRYTTSIAILFVVWEVASKLSSVPDYILPDPGRVFATLWHESALFTNAAWLTTRNTLLGGSLGIGFGIITGLALARFALVRRLMEPYLTIFQSFPRESLFPLLVVWLGFGMATKVVSAALLSFFPAAIVTLNGLRDVRRDYVTLIRSWGADKNEEFLFCRLPATIPTLMGGIRVALPLALIGAVLGEFMGGIGGLGYVIISSGSAFRVDRIFAAIVMLAFIGVSLLAIIELLDRLFLSHYHQETYREG